MADMFAFAHEQEGDDALDLQPQLPPVNGKDKMADLRIKALRGPAREQELLSLIERLQKRLAGTTEELAAVNCRLSAVENGLRCRDEQIVQLCEAGSYICRLALQVGECMEMALTRSLVFIGEDGQSAVVLLKLGDWEFRIEPEARRFKVQCVNLIRPQEGELGEDGLTTMAKHVIASALAHAARGLEGCPVNLAKVHGAIYVDPAEPPTTSMSWFTPLSLRDAIAGRHGI